MRIANCKDPARIHIQAGSFFFTLPGLIPLFLLELHAFAPRITSEKAVFSLIFSTFALRQGIHTPCPSGINRIL